MKSKRKFDEMLNFINDELKSSQYDLKYTNDENRFYAQNNGTKLGLIILNYQIPQNELSTLYIKNIKEYGSNHSIFFKDVTTFFKRMVDNSKLRIDKSLKKIYTIRS
ncbi:MAG: hypothetical protein PF569_07915 [Candidatus Woesearchaeota archaeon]|jgi:hypothetical protein|nr:hypothetical protein [Candidatus Woesearchaeota archaeon]